jgi:hypothetical protein
MENTTETENEDDNEEGSESKIQNDNGNENEEDLEAFAMNNAGTSIVVFLVSDDHLGECCE